MSKDRIYLCLAHMSESGAEQQFIKEAFDTNWVVPLGPNVNAFEQELERFVCSKDSSSKIQDSSETCNMNHEPLAKRVVALSAGTAAIHLAMIACGVGPGDEVCVQSFTFCASAFPISYLGATPVLIDSEKDSWNMDPELLEEAIKDRIAKTGKKPKAIMPVALYGMPYRIEDILAVANKYDIPVVEDTAEGLGSRYGGRMLGSFGKYAILSFNGNKMITTSGGGALVCPNDKVANKIKWLATQAREGYPYYQHEAIGYNYRMSNICAGIGRGQMTIVDDHIQHHKHVQALYEEMLADVPGVTVHIQPNERRKTKDGNVNKFDSNYWLSTILLDEKLKVKNEERAYHEAVKEIVGGVAGTLRQNHAAHTDCEPNSNVEALRLALDEAGIESRPLWKPLHCQPVYRRGEVSRTKFQVQGQEITCQTSGTSVAYVNGVSESLFKRGLCLPTGPMVSDEDVARIVKVIKENVELA